LLSQWRSRISMLSTRGRPENMRRGRIVFDMRNTQLDRPAPGGRHERFEGTRQLFRPLPQSFW